jgi:hypothetical protein
VLPDVERANLAAKEDKMSVMPHLTATLFWLQDQTATCSELLCYKVLKLFLF